MYRQGTFTFVWNMTQLVVSLAYRAIHALLSAIVVMSVTNCTHRDDGDGTLSPADLELFSLFMQYPKMTFNSDELPQTVESFNLTSTENVNSSPLSTAPDTNVKNSSFISASTAQTTPLCPLILAELNSPPPESWTEYLHLVQRNDLPQECQQYFVAMGQCAVNIGLALFRSTQYRQTFNVIAVGEWLSELIRYSCGQLNRQINRVAHLKTLLAFTSRPAESQMWSTYQQRARLILAYVSYLSHGGIQLTY